MKSRTWQNDKLCSRQYQNFIFRLDERKKNITKVRPAVTGGKVSYHFSNIFLILTEGTVTPTNGWSLSYMTEWVNIPAAHSDWPDGFCHCLGVMTFPLAGSLAQDWGAGMGHRKCCVLEIGLSSSRCAAKAQDGAQHKASASDWHQHATATGTTKPQREREKDLRAAPQDPSERSCWCSLLHSEKYPCHWNCQH